MAIAFNCNDRATSRAIPLTNVWHASDPIAEVGFATIFGLKGCTDPGKDKTYSFPETAEV